MEKFGEFKAEVMSKGNYLSTSYGVSKYFEWRLYSYEGKRYDVSMFSDEVEEVKRNYCNDCGRGTYNIRVVMGQYTCPSCAKEIN